MQEEEELAINEILATSPIYSCHVLDSDEIVLAAEEPKQDVLLERSKSVDRSLADCISISEEEEWQPWMALQE